VKDWSTDAAIYVLLMPGHLLHGRGEEALGQGLTLQRRLSPRVVGGGPSRCRQDQSSSIVGGAVIVAWLGSCLLEAWNPGPFDLHREPVVVFELTVIREVVFQVGAVVSRRPRG
jgi:hypothetical protein